MTPTLPAPQDVASEIRSARLGIDVSELHGALCGWLAGGGENTADWVAQVMADGTLPRESEHGAFERMRIATSAQLADRAFGLELLLADDDASLSERSGSLFAWCRGFLGGFGLATGKSPPLSEESREALADLAKFAAATAQDEGDEEDEQALVEIEEFVRVSALLMYGDCVLGPTHRQQFH